MSIASELNRLQQAKIDLAASIAAKGVTVPAATTIDGYAALVDQIQTGGSLPIDVAKIEYLESTGTQYIQLACDVSAGTYFAVGGVVIPIYTSAQQDYTVFGANPYAQFTADFYIKKDTTNSITYTSIVGGLGAAGGVGGGWGGEVGTEVSFELSTTEKVINGVHTSISRPLKAAITAFRIFGGYKNDNRYPIRIKSFYIKKGNDTLYDLMPIRIGQVGYMYDNISNTIFGNAGTGNFICGPDVI